MNHKRRWYTLIFSFILVTTIFFIPIASVSATSGEVAIDGMPNDILFNVENLKPGDWVTKTYSVTNNGETSVEYGMSSAFLSGSEKFYNQLLLKVELDNQVLYEGKLREFTELEMRTIEASEVDELDFRVDIPESLGNEYQALKAEFQLRLYTTGAATAASGGFGNTLPDTASSMFTYLLIGIVLITISGITLLSYRRKRLE